MFDHAAAAAQVAGCISYGGAVSVSWQPAAGAAIGPFSAIVADEDPEKTGVQLNTGNAKRVVLTVARSLFGAELPRQGQYFTGTGVSFRIEKTPPNTFGLSLAYVCVPA